MFSLQTLLYFIRLDFQRDDEAIEDLGHKLSLVCFSQCSHYDQLRLVLNLAWIRLAGAPGVWLCTMIRHWKQLQVQRSGATGERLEEQDFSARGLVFECDCASCYSRSRGGRQHLEEKASSEVSHTRDLVTWQSWRHRHHRLTPSASVVAFDWASESVFKTSLSLSQMQLLSREHYDSDGLLDRNIQCLAELLITGSSCPK